MPVKEMSWLRVRTSRCSGATDVEADESQWRDEVIPRPAIEWTLHDLVRRTW